MRAVLAAGAVWLLAGCADKLPVDAADHHTALPPKAAEAAAPARTYPVPVYSAPHSATDLAAAPAAPSSAAPTSAPAGPPDTCGAAGLAYLVGKPRTEIPIPADMTHRRVVCSTCPVTQDARPDRQTITYDSGTNLVTKVSCG